MMKLGLLLTLLDASCYKGRNPTQTDLKGMIGASLVAQWLRVCLPMQEARVRALVWEDPTCRGAAGPVSRNC